MAPHTLQLIIYLLSISVFVAAATAVGAYINRVMAVQSEAVRRSPRAMKTK